MENDHPGWRKMYSSNKQRHFSCWKTTPINGFEEIVLLGNAETALQELDKLFKMLAPFMKILQRQKKD